MQKRAQPYNPSEFAGYGQGGLAGYGQGGYDVGLENVGLIPGMAPQLPEKSHYPSIVSPWAVPISLATTGLIGYALLKHMGRRLATRAAQRATALPSNATAMEIAQRFAPKHASIITALGQIIHR